MTEQLCFCVKSISYIRQGLSGMFQLIHNVDIMFQLIHNL
jgi:hypothetical protein